MKPKILKLQVSELSPEEMKKVSVYGDETPDPPKKEGCSALAQCPDGSHVYCTTEISGAKCEVLYSGTDNKTIGVSCAGSKLFCSGSTDSGTGGSGDDKPTPPPVTLIGKL